MLLYPLTGISFLKVWDIRDKNPLEKINADKYNILGNSNIQHKKEENQSRKEEYKEAEA